MFTISARLFRAASNFASMDPTEGILQTVHVEPRDDGAFIIGARRSGMFVGFDPECQAQAPVNFRPTHELLSRKDVKYGDNRLQVNPSALDYSGFVDWRRLVPVDLVDPPRVHDPESVVALADHALTAIRTASLLLSRASKPEAVPVVLSRGANGNQAVLCRFVGHEDAFVLVMPPLMARTDQRKGELPGFMHKEKFR